MLKTQRIFPILRGTAHGYSRAGCFLNTLDNSKRQSATHGDVCLVVKEVAVLESAEHNCSLPVFLVVISNACYMNELRTQW